MVGGVLGRKEVLDLLASHGVRPSRALGQNFVIDPNTVRRIARLAGVGEGDRVVEIGAGVGSLTTALVETGAEVTAVEVDRYLVPVLQSVVGEAVRIVEGDALRLDWDAVLGGGAEGWVMVGNLPYNVATPLVMGLLEGVPGIERMVVMVQREVAERLAAGPGSKAYGAVSAKVGYWATSAVVATVPPTVFVPQPKVDSAVVSITRREVLPDVPWHRYARLVEAGFATRRKMLRGTVGSLVSAECFEAAGVRPDQRGEELDVDAWCRLASCASSLPPS